MLRRPYRKVAARPPPSSSIRESVVPLTALLPPAQSPLLVGAMGSLFVKRPSAMERIPRTASAAARADAVSGDVGRAASAAREAPCSPSDESP